MENRKFTRSSSTTSWSNEKFISKARSRHGDTFDYSKVEYKGSKEKVTIVCKEHGDFEQTASSHTRGMGCRKCADSKQRGVHNTTLAERNKESYKKRTACVYILYMKNDKESFYKIGLTTNLNRRVKYLMADFEIVVLEEINTNLYEAILLENKLQCNNKKHKYKPKTKFNGYTECFKEYEL